MRVISEISCMGCLQVIADCHAEEVVHGDLKAENIMLSADKTIVTLVDFGTASLCEGVGPSAHHYFMSYST
jgi:serine/threonine protein kinase